jgi:hypothetical protein
MGQSESRQILNGYICKRLYTPFQPKNVRAGCGFGLGLRNNDDVPCLCAYWGLFWCWDFERVYAYVLCARSCTCASICDSRYACDSPSTCDSPYICDSPFPYTSASSDTSAPPKDAASCDIRSALGGLVRPPISFSQLILACRLERAPLHLVCIIALDLDVSFKQSHCS